MLNSFKGLDAIEITRITNFSRTNQILKRFETNRTYFLLFIGYKSGYISLNLLTGSWYNFIILTSTNQWFQQNFIWILIHCLPFWLFPTTFSLLNSKKLYCCLVIVKSQLPTKTAIINVEVKLWLAQKLRKLIYFIQKR